MAGELEHIRPTDPSYGNPATRTKNINFTDANGVLHSVTHVYWSPTNDPNDRKLIWQRAVYVKYIMYFVASGSTDNNFTFNNFFINGKDAGNNLTNGKRLQYGDGGTWHDLESSIISAWQNGHNSAAYGHKLKLWFTATNPTSFGVMGNTDYMQHTNFTLNIIGVDANNVETTLKTVNVTLAQGQTYTIDL